MAAGPLDWYYAVLLRVCTARDVTPEMCHTSWVDHFRDALVACWRADLFVALNESNVRNGTNGFLGGGGRYRRNFTVVDGERRLLPLNQLGDAKRQQIEAALAIIDARDPRLPAVLLDLLNPLYVLPDKVRCLFCELLFCANFSTETKRPSVRRSARATSERAARTKMMTTSTACPTWKTTTKTKTRTCQLRPLASVVVV